MRQTLDARLAAAASFVRRGGAFADIGSDHAYLPIHLLTEGRIDRAVVSDIGEGPLAAARAHLEEAGLLDRVRLIRTDGLRGLAEEGLTDIAICGMGGELIVKILSEASFVRRAGIRLILQPMTHTADLRRFLYENGFLVEEERFALSAGRVYTCLSVGYNGKSRSLSAAEAEFGLCPLPVDPEQRALCRRYLARRLAALEKQVKGRSAAGLPAGEEQELFTACQNILNSISED